MALLPTSCVTLSKFFNLSEVLDIMILNRVDVGIKLVSKGLEYTNLLSLSSSIISSFSLDHKFLMYRVCILRAQQIGCSQ